MASPRPRQAGFTLLELLVALTVFGFLMVALTQGMRFGIEGWSRQSRRLATTSELDAVARTLRNLLSAIPVSPAESADPGAPPVPISLTGKAHQLDLVGELPNGFGGVQLADMRLTLKDGALILIWRPHRRERPQAGRQPSETALLNGVSQVQFAYWDPLAKRWLDQWDGPTIPALIRVRLGFERGDSRHWPDLLVAPLARVPEA